MPRRGQTKDHVGFQGDPNGKKRLNNLNFYGGFYDRFVYCSRGSGGEEQKLFMISTAPAIGIVMGK